MSTKTLITILIITTTLILTTSKTYASTYYVSPTGNDNNTGTVSSNAFRTIDKGISLLQPGDLLEVASGNYSSFTLSKSGTPTSPIRISAANAKIDQVQTAIKLSGSNLNISGFEVSNTESHAVLISGKNVTFSNFIIRDSVLENMGSNGSCSGAGGWGSGLKVMVGAEDIKIENGSIFQNCGEGLGITRGINVTVNNLTAYDNYSVNFYLDNSQNVTLKNSHSYCTNNTHYYRNGKPAAGILIGEESYDNWGAKLQNINIYNNIISGCTGISFYGSEVSPGGLKNSIIAHNTIHNLVGSTRGINIANEPNNTNIRILNNITGGTVTAGTTINSSNNLTFANYVANPNPTMPQTFIPSSTTSNITGTPILEISKDYNNYARPNPPTIGALEIQSVATTNPSYIPGDLNQDNHVDIYDFNELISYFGTKYSIIDFNFILTNFGS